MPARAVVRLRKTPRADIESAPTAREGITALLAA